jgi:ribosomal protein S18 acetylase RimI-like enzyme
MDFHQRGIHSCALPGQHIFARFIEENIATMPLACSWWSSTANRGLLPGHPDRHPPALAESDFGQIFDFGVTATCRRAGIGEQMFQTLCDWFRREGIRRIEVRHSTFNEIASRFWPKMGFQPYLQTLFLELKRD